MPPHAVDDASAIAAFLDGCEAANGPLDVVAYVSPPVSVGKALDLEHEVYGRVLRDELLLPILLLREAARRMAGRGYGRLLSFCSMSGKTGVHPGVSPYAAAKGADRFLAFAGGGTGAFGGDRECRGDGAVRCAGPQDRRRTRPRRQGHTRGTRRPFAGGRGGGAVLASRQSGYITGETLNMSGGRFMD